MTHTKPSPSGTHTPQSIARYTFSAKEKDTETGYGYFGSRYYSSDLSIWLSVDPMSDKYPSMSPYVYCADNSVKLVDPNGEEIGDVDEASQKKIDALTNKSGADYNRAFTRIFKQLERSKKVYNFYEAKESEISGNTQGKVTRSEDGNSINIISSIGGVRTSKEGGFSKEYATMFEETFHAADYDKGRLDLNNPTCRDEARAWKFASKAPGTNSAFIDESGLPANTLSSFIKSSRISITTTMFKYGLEYKNNAKTQMLFSADNAPYNHLPLK